MYRKKGGGASGKWKAIFSALYQRPFKALCYRSQLRDYRPFATIVSIHSTFYYVFLPPCRKYSVAELRPLFMGELK